MNIFADKLTGDITNTQRFWTMQGHEPRYRVDFEELTSSSYIVSIYDYAAMKAVHVFEFHTSEAAGAVFEALNAELDYWDCGDYYSPANEDRTQQEAVEDYERANRGFMAVAV